MRILHLIADLDNDVGRTVATLARLERRAGHEPVVVTSRSTDDAIAADRALAADRVRVVPWLVAQTPAARLQLIADLQRENLHAVDIVHAHDHDAELVARALNGPDGRPATLRSVHSAGAGIGAGRPVDIASLNCLERVVTSSRASHNLLAQLGVAPSRLRVVAPGVEPVIDPLDGLDSADVELHGMRAAARVQRPTICCIDSLCDRRGERLLLEAIGAIPEGERPMSVFVNAREPNGIVGLAVERGLRQWVRVVDRRPNARPFVRLADWLVVPSLRADAHVAPLCEAFCDRVPVVVCNVEEALEFLGDQENGVTFARGNRRALAEALRSALAMPANARQQVAGRAHAAYRTRYRAAAMAEGYIREYEDLLAEHSASAYPRVA